MKLINKLYVRAGIAVAATLSAVAPAFADNIDTQINGLGTSATSYIADTLGVVVIVAGGFWGIAMLKKAMSKAT